MSPAARALSPYIRRQWKALAGAGAATGVLTAADLAKPWPLAIVVDQLLGRTAPFALDGADWRSLIGVAILVLVIALSEAAALYFSNLWLQTAGERISHELRIAVYDHLQRLSLAFHQKRQKGDLLTRVTGDVNAMGDLFAQQLGAITQALLLSLGMTVVLLILDPVLALVSLATTPALLGISWIYRRRVRSTARVRRAHEGHIASMAGEALSAMAVVKAFGGERLEADRVRAGSEQRMAVGVDIARLQAGFDGLVGSVRAIGTALVIVVGVMRVASGALSPGELLVFVSYTRKAYNPLKSLARESTKVAATMAKADRIAEILAADDVLEERPGAYRGGRAARRRGGRARVVRLRPRAPGPARRVAGGRRRRVRRARGPVRGRQVDARGAGRALPRPDRGPRADRRPRRARLRARVAARRRSRSCSRTPCCSPARCATTSPTAPTRASEEIVDAARAAVGARLHLRAAGGLRHRARPAGRRAVRRPAPAHRDRPHAAARPADPAARRADHRARRRQRGAAARRARSGSCAAARRSSSATRRGSRGSPTAS